MPIDEEYFTQQLKDRRKWPRYTAEQQQLIGEFLAAYYTEAEEMLATMVEQAKATKNDPLSANTRDFWRNALGVLRWLGYRVKHKQKHLRVLQLLREQQPPETPCGKP